MINMGRILQQSALRFADYPAVINVERGRRFTYARMHELTNRLSNALKHRFGLCRGDFYATILDNDNMALFHPWMLKCPVGAVWIDVRDSTEAQVQQIDHVQPMLIFLEERMLPLLYEDLQAREINVVTMDRPQKSWPHVYNFWDLVEQAAAVEVGEEFVADDSSEHISVLRFTGGTTAGPNAPRIPFLTCGSGAAIRRTSTKPFPSSIHGHFFSLPCIMLLPDPWSFRHTSKAVQSYPQPG